MSEEGIVMKKPVTIVSLIVVLVFLFNGQLAQALEEVTISRILESPDSYDGKEVLVIGVITNLRLKTSKAGRDYTTFSLKGEEGKSLNIFTWGHKNLKEGQKTKVTGTYRKIKKVGRYTFYNEVEALEIINSGSSPN